MKEHYTAQGSDEWKRLRAGCITASNFHLIRASAKLKSGPNKGEYGEKAKNYAFRLAIERISGVPLDDGYETWAMERGHELEPDARRAHESRHGVLVKPVGFVTTDDGLFGASADGYVDAGGAEEEGAEYKCFVAPDKLRAILLDGDNSDVIDQVQGGMWLTGFKRWHFGLYCPALAPVGRDFTLQVIERDEAFIEALEADLWDFAKLVAQYESELRGGKTTAPWAEAIAAPPAAAPAAIPESIF